MSNKIEFTPLISPEKDSPFCYLLEVENVKILLDCGWESELDLNDFANLSSIAKDIELVLLSSCDFQHIGGYPYAFGHYGLTCPIYATYPVAKMGHLLLYDYYQSYFEAGEPIFTLDEIDKAIDHITQVKYSQKVFLRGSGFRVSITALPSGVSIGSCVWLIEVDGGESRIVYSPEINHQSDRHLNAISLDQLLKPTVLITSSLCMDRSFIKKSTKEAEITKHISETLANKGKIMIVTDTSARSLELLLLIDEIRNSDDIYKIAEYYFVNHVSHHVVEFAKFQLEWMNSNLLNNFQLNSKNPFSLSLNNLVKPAVILVSDISIEKGNGLKFLLNFASNPYNHVIFTKRRDCFMNLKEINSNSTIKIDINKRNMDFSKSYERKTIVQPEPTDSIIMDEIDEDESFEVDQTQKNQSRIIKPKFIFSQYNTRRMWDAYGEDIEPEAFILGNEGLKNKQVSLKSKGLVDALAQIKFDPSVIPHSFVAETHLCEIYAGVSEILMDGLIDSDSMTSIMKMIMPNNLIIINGSHASTAKLRDCSTSLDIKNIYNPQVMETVSIVDEKKFIRVSLKNQLISSLQFVDCKNYQVSWLESRVKKSLKSRNNDSFILKKTKNEQIHQSVFLNEIKLSELSQLLIKNGYTVRFKNGVLLFKDGKVAIRKKQSGEISVNGVLSKEYFQIRKIIYDQLCII